MHAVRLDCIASSLLALAELNRLSGTSVTSLAAALRASGAGGANNVPVSIYIYMYGLISAGAGVSPNVQTVLSNIQST